jgi:hypothetical protein
MERITLPVTETQIVVEVILKAVAPCSIYVFGCRDINDLQRETKNSHFDILVFSNIPVTGSHLMNEIKERTNKAVTATVLVHNVTQLATKQKSQQYFFDWVLRYGQRIALDKVNIPYILNHTTERDLETDTRYWHKCVAVAQFNIQAAKESPQLEVTLCKIALLNKACVQFAVGVIRVFLGYTPNEFGLKYLLQLCGHFTALPSQLFKHTTQEAIQRYKMLCAPPSMLTHWTRLNASEQDFLWLLDACTTFLRLATDIVTPELDRLEKTFTKSLLL